MREILEKLINEEIDIKTAENLIKSKNIMEFDEIAKFDSNRQNRTGFPEAVFAPSKDYDDLLLICKKYIESETSQNLIITKFFGVLTFDLFQQALATAMIYMLAYFSAYQIAVLMTIITGNILYAVPLTGLVFIYEIRYNKISKID